MDVNGIKPNLMNNNFYNSNVSEYAQTNTVASIPKVETKSIEVKNNKKNEEYDKNELDDALKKINRFLKDEHTHAEYSYHKEMNTMMIKIINEDTKEVILEIPPKKILDMVASMCKQFRLFAKKA